MCQLLCIKTAWNSLLCRVQEITDSPHCKVNVKPFYKHKSARILYFHLLFKGTLHSKLAIDYFSWHKSVYFWKIFTTKKISIDAVVT